MGAFCIQVSEKMVDAVNQVKRQVQIETLNAEIQQNRRIFFGEDKYAKVVLGMKFGKNQESLILMLFGIFKFLCLLQVSSCCLILQVKSIWLYNIQASCSSTFLGLLAKFNCSPVLPFSRPKYYEFPFYISFFDKRSYVPSLSAKIHIG